MIPLSNRFFKIQAKGRRRFKKKQRVINVNGSNEANFKIKFKNTQTQAQQQVYMIKS